MLFKFRPEAILNPSLSFVSYIILAYFFYESNPTIFSVLGCLLFGFFVGSAWRGASELWERQRWLFFRDGEWLSQKARDWDSLKYKLLLYWILESLIRILFVGMLIILFGAGCALMIGFYESDLGRWGSFLASWSSFMLLGLLPLPLILLYEGLGRNENSLPGRYKKLLKEYKSLDDEFPKLKEWELRKPDPRMTKKTTTEAGDHRDV